jgi:hypothetical protein
VRIAGTSFRDACKIVEDAIAMFPEDLDGHILHARALLGLGKNDKVAALARKKLPRELTGVGDTYITRHGAPVSTTSWCLVGVTFVGVFGLRRSVVKAS